MRCDVAIVGGGPAGSACARELVRSGFDVIVLDKARFPRDKTCAGWITPEVVAELDLDLDDYARGRTLQPIRAFRTTVQGGREVRTDFGRTVSWGIRRTEFDRYLLERTGARRLESTPVRTLARTRDRWWINGTIEARLLVGAGGHFCPVARRLNGGGRTESIVVARECEVRMSPAQAARCRVGPDEPTLVFSHDLKGYGWVFRKGDWINIGLGRQDREGLPAHVARFVATLPALGLEASVGSGAWHGHAYLLYGGGRRRLVDDGVVLVGDAAGLAYPMSGEGILTAIVSGSIAARVMAEAAGDTGRERLLAYERGLRERFGRPRRARALSASVRAATGRALFSTAWFTRHVLLSRWFLHQNGVRARGSGTGATPAVGDRAGPTAAGRTS